MDTNLLTGLPHSKLPMKKPSIVLVLSLCACMKLESYVIKFQSFETSLHRPISPDVTRLKISKIISLGRVGDSSFFFVLRRTMMHSFLNQEKTKKQTEKNEGCDMFRLWQIRMKSYLNRRRSSREREKVQPFGINKNKKEKNRFQYGFAAPIRDFTE